MNIYACPAGCNFMQNFVANLYEGKILKQFGTFALVDTEIFVPTRRAARSLREEFIAYNSEVVLLPKITSFADIDCGEILVSISNMERIILLAQLIYSWKQHIKNHAALADALRLAQDLSSLIDEAYLSKVNWQKLDDIENNLNSELSHWWQLTNEFLQIAIKQYPKILEEKGVLDVGQAMALRFTLKAKQIKQSNKSYIVLGASGAVPCVADFLQIVAQHPNGAIILPTLDRDLPSDVWHKFGQIKELNLYNQAQYNYFKLLKKFKITRKDVKFIGEVSKAKRMREYYVSHALMPAQTTSYWHRLKKTSVPEAFGDVALIEAADERQEALAIACALRLATKDPNKKAALVTSNRNLALRVTTELARFGVKPNDSAQIAFLNSNFGKWVQLILLNLTQSDVHNFLALLRNPFTSLGLEKAKLDYMIDLYEKYRLRGASLRFSLLNIKFLTQQMAEQWLQRDEAAASFNTDLSLIDELVKLIEQAILPLQILFHKKKVNLCEALKALLDSIKLLVHDFDNLLKDLSANAFIKFCHEIFDGSFNIDFAPLEFGPIFEALISNLQLEATPIYSNIHIWGIIEARLQHADTVIISGLNENQFPLAPKNSAFLSYSTMLQLGMEPAEAQIGASALEFQYLLGMDKVILSRSKRIDGVIQTASRWLQRLQALLGDIDPLKQRGQLYLDYAFGLDVAKAAPCSIPQCRPPLEKRPKAFSISDVEMLQISPYAIYAKKILKLRPLEELVKLPSYAEKGILYHDIVARFCQDRGEIAEYEKNFAKITQICFAQKALPLDIEKLWYEEINKIATSFLEDEKKYELVNTYVEISSKPVNIGQHNAFIYGRADRIDIIKDGNSYKAELIDYKTGSAIAKKHVNMLVKPQLLLEANLLLRGGFNIKETPLKLANIYYSYLKDDEKAKIGKKIAIEKNTDLTELIEKAWCYVAQLIDSYFVFNQPYIAYKDALTIDMQRNPYHHLNRYDEWSR